jgi:hypothetical protein
MDLHNRDNTHDEIADLYGDTLEGGIATIALTAQLLSKVFGKKDDSQVTQESDLSGLSIEQNVLSDRDISIEQTVPTDLGLSIEQNAPKAERKFEAGDISVETTTPAQVSQAQPAEPKEILQEIPASPVTPAPVSQTPGAEPKEIPQEAPATPATPTPVNQTQPAEPKEIPQEAPATPDLDTPTTANNSKSKQENKDRGREDQSKESTQESAAEPALPTETKVLFGKVDNKVVNNLTTDQEKAVINMISSKPGTKIPGAENLTIRFKGEVIARTNAEGVLETNEAYGKIPAADLKRLQERIASTPKTVGEVATPAVPQPAAAQPAVPQPAVPQPAAAQPAVPQPAAAQPAAPQPAVPQPAVPQPAVPQPAAPQPAAPQPAVPQPAAPQPEAAQQTVRETNAERPTPDKPIPKNAREIQPMGTVPDELKITHPKPVKRNNITSQVATAVGAVATAENGVEQLSQKITTTAPPEATPKIFKASDIEGEVKGVSKPRIAETLNQIESNRDPQSNAVTANGFVGKVETNLEGERNYTLKNPQGETILSAQVKDDRPVVTEYDGKEVGKALTAMKAQTAKTTGAIEATEQPAPAAKEVSQSTTTTTTLTPETQVTTTANTTDIDAVNLKLRQSERVVSDEVTLADRVAPEGVAVVAPKPIAEISTAEVQKTQVQPASQAAPVNDEQLTIAAKTAVLVDRVYEQSSLNTVKMANAVYSLEDEGDRRHYRVEDPETGSSIEFSRHLKTNEIVVDKPGDEKISESVNTIEAKMSSRVPGYTEKVEDLLKTTEREPVGAAKILAQAKVEQTATPAREKTQQPTQKQGR